jgi:hypothetical protein
MLTWKRTLCTTSSERFLAQREGKDVVAVDLHYIANGTVAGTANQKNAHANRVSAKRPLQYGIPVKYVDVWD